MNIRTIVNRQDSANPLVITDRHPKVKKFGKYKAPHMFSVKYRDGEWQRPIIQPYADLRVDPAAKVFHYGQGIFEGAKAFKHADGEIYTFRFDENIKRLNKTAEFLDMPQVPADLQMQGLHALLNLDRDYFPINEGATMYVRPFLICDEGTLGVGAGDNYQYNIILSPSGPYFGETLNPISVFIAGRSFGRVPHGGLGSIKAGGNYQGYAPHMKVINKFGADQPLYGFPLIEETGATNHFHITNSGEFVVPKFNENILESITTRSLLEISQQVGLKPTAKDIYIDEFLRKLQIPNQPYSINEAGGIGTAAVIVPAHSYMQINHNPSFKELQTKTADSFNTTTYRVPSSPGEFTKKLYNLYTGIQQGEVEDKHGWLKKVERRI